MAVQAQTASVTAPAGKLDAARLDQLLASVALYPDSLLSQILMASTYPNDVAAAARWSAQHTSVSGDAAVSAVQNESWDPSVKSLAAFPSVLDLMGRQPAWVTSLGNAFLAQPDDVMSSVQRLRAQAKAAGNLKSTPQQTVTSTAGINNTTAIAIAPANPQVVYVPTYNPTVVYGPWPYPAYPPYYYPPPPGSVFAGAVVAGIGFGIGVATVNALWGNMNWGHYDVDINVNHYNHFNPNHPMPPPPPNGGGGAPWQHNPANRGNVPYPNPDVAHRYGPGGQGHGPGGQGFGPGPQPSGRDGQRERAAQAFEQRTGQSIPGHPVPGENRFGGNRPGANGGGVQHEMPHNLGPEQRQRYDQQMAQHRSEFMNRDSALHGAGNGDAMRGQLERGRQAQSSFHMQRGGAHFGRR